MDELSENISLLSALLKLDLRWRTEAASSMLLFSGETNNGFYILFLGKTIFSLLRYR